MTHIVASFRSIPGPLEGAHAVEVFIIISGFVITLTIVEKADPYLVFIGRRAFRIFPVYLLILVIAAITLKGQAQAIAGSPIAGSLQNQHRLVLNAASLSHFWRHLVAHLLLLQGLVPERIAPFAPSTILGAAWSISLEWQFYLVAPLAIIAVTARKSWPAIVLILIMAGLQGKLGRAFLPNQALYFAIGIASYFFARDLYVGRYARPAMLFCLATAILTRDVAILVWAVVLGCALWPAAPGGGAIRQTLTSAPMQQLGKISYSTYLVHVPVIVAVMAAINPVTRDPQLYAMLLTIFSLGGTLTCSYILYTWVEAPSIRFGSSVLGRGNRTKISQPDPPGHAW